MTTADTTETTTETTTTEAPAQGSIPGAVSITARIAAEKAKRDAEPTKHVTIVAGSDGLHQQLCTCDDCKKRRSYRNDGSVLDVVSKKVIYGAGSVYKDARGELVPGKGKPAQSAAPTLTSAPARKTATRAERKAAKKNGTSLPAPTKRPSMTKTERAKAERADRAAERAERAAERQAERDRRAEQQKEAAEKLAAERAAVEKHNAGVDKALKPLLAKQERAQVALGKAQEVYDAAHKAVVDVEATRQPMPGEKPARAARAVREDGSAPAPRNPALLFFGEFNKLFKRTGATQRMVSTTCKAHGISQRDQSAANVTRCYEIMLAEKTISAATKKAS